MSDDKLEEIEKEVVEQEDEMVEKDKSISDEGIGIEEKEEAGEEPRPEIEDVLGEEADEL